MPNLRSQGRSNLREYSAPQHLCPGGCLVSSCALPTLSPRLSSWNLSFILLFPLRRALCLPTTCPWPKVEANSGSFLCHRVLPQVLLPDNSVLAGLCKLQQQIQLTGCHAISPGSLHIPGAHCQEVTFLAGPLGRDRFCEKGLCSRLMPWHVSNTVYPPSIAQKEGELSREWASLTHKKAKRFFSVSLRCIKSKPH